MWLPAWAYVVTFAQTNYVYVREGSPSKEGFHGTHGTPFRSATELTTHTATSGEQISVHFGEGMSHRSPQPTTNTRIPDEFCAMQTLYLLDRFGVSDQFYHELTQVE